MILAAVLFHPAVTGDKTDSLSGEPAGHGSQRIIFDKGGGVPAPKHPAAAEQIMAGGREQAGNGRGDQNANTHADIGHTGIGNRWRGNLQYPVQQGK